MFKKNNVQQINNLPNHIGFIMDGNGRWATKRGLPRTLGHREGAKTIEKIVDECLNQNIQAISFFAFSTENFKRPKEEVNYIFDLLEEFGDRCKDSYKNKNIRFLTAGDISKIPERLTKKLINAKEETKNNTGMIVCIAIAYGGQDEIIRAANKSIKNGKIEKDDFEKNLDTYTLPELDLIIRTGGEKRLSNFFMYQSAYSELYFSETFWPDFDKKELYKILIDFSNRTRRKGGL